MSCIAACESLLQPTIAGRADPADVGLFQWNDKPPWHWWSGEWNYTINAQSNRA